MVSELPETEEITLELSKTKETNNLGIVYSCQENFPPMFVGIGKVLDHFHR